jgi:hypothetical protein
MIKYYLNFVRKNLFSVIGLILCVCFAMVSWVEVVTPNPTVYGVLCSLTHGVLWIVMGGILVLRIQGKIWY